MSDRPRLVIEISDAGEQALADLAQLEEAAGIPRMNKTTIINRALIAFAEQRRLQHAGATFYYFDPETGERMTWLPST